MSLGISRAVAGGVLVALVLAGDALACVCAQTPISQRLDESDLAFVGRIESERAGEINGAPVRYLTVAVEQRVKGDVGDTLEVRSPARTDCDLRIPENRSVGLLLNRSPDGAWLGSACSVVDPGELVAAGGEPRGGAIKVVVGVVVLGLVLALAWARLRRGSRPDLPGAPRA